MNLPAVRARHVHAQNTVLGDAGVNKLETVATAAKALERKVCDSSF